MFSECVLCLILIGIIFRIWYRLSRPINFPPGPIGLPILGNLLAFRKSPLKAMTRWKREYGDIVGLNLGESKAVLISDYHLLKEAFNNESFNARPNFKPALLFTGGGAQGTLTSDGDSWSVIRRFTVMNLNKLGFGKKSMETMIQNDIDELRSELAEELSKPISLHGRFYVPVNNHLWHILVGQRIGKEEYGRFKDSLLRLHKTLWQPIGSAVWFMPSLANIFPKWTGWQNLVESMPSVKNLLNDEIQKHQTNNLHLNDSDDQKPEHLIDAYLRKISITTEQTSQFYHSTGENHMRSMLMNIFVTASEAMSNTLHWTFTYLSLYPDVQRKLYEEIEDIVGINRSPSLADAPNMPYAKAVMQEVFRIASTSPFSNFRLTTEDVEFHGYMIPKNTVVIGNLYSIHHDPKLWGDPEVFRPERFLDNSVTQPPLIPFSSGLRVCLGQTFARNLLFLFMTSLCQHFEFQLDPSQPRPTTDNLTDQSPVSIFRFCQHFNFILLDRTKNSPHIPSEAA